MQRNLQVYLFIKHFNLEFKLKITQPLNPLIFETFCSLVHRGRKRENHEKSLSRPEKEKNKLVKLE